MAAALRAEVLCNLSLQLVKTGEFTWLDGRNKLLFEGVLDRVILPVYGFKLIHLLLNFLKLGLFSIHFARKLALVSLDIPLANVRKLMPIRLVNVVCQCQAWLQSS